MSDLDIENICRLCCEKKGRLRSLFEEEPRSESRSLQQIILDVTRLEVEPGDGMPQKICRTCVTTLVKMHETIEGYRTNNSMLRQKLGEMRLLSLDDIKEEEEVDIEVLEKTCLKDMMVENVYIKPEADEEYLDYEVLEEIKESKPVDEDKGSETDTAYEGMEGDDDDDKDISFKDVKPPVRKRKVNQATSDKVRVASATQEQCRRTNRNDPQIGRRRRRKSEMEEFNGNRPRLHDFKCYICKSDSHGTPQALFDHLNSHLDLLPYTCPECVMETVIIKSISLLNCHKRQHLNPEKCPYCDKRYTCKNNVALHVKMHHTVDASQTSFTCDQCGQVYPTKSSLSYHMKLHTTAASCEFCGKVFKERSKLRRHIQNRHEKLRRYECHICKKKLTQIEALRYHIKKFHSDQQFKCSYCPKTFGSEAVQRHHESKHLNNPNFACPTNWQEHYTVVDPKDTSSNKLKKCNLCGVTTRNMGPHLKRAHFPTEHRCEVCGRTFKTKPSYNAHVQEHEHGKAFRCPICGREFNERKHLIGHLRTKKHRDHPLARKWLSTVKTAAKVTKTEETDSDVDEENTRDEPSANDFDVETDKLM